MQALLTGLCILLVELLVAILLWFLGFRITYEPTLENSWDAISACAAWASVVVAGLAIYYAILVPKKIAERQDQIALFEKRVEIYSAIQDICSCVAQIEKAKTDAQILTSFKLHIGNATDIGNVQHDISLVYKIRQTETLIIAGDFLFPEYDVRLLQDMTLESINLIFATIESTRENKSHQLTPKAAKHKAKLSEIYHKVHPTMIDAMETQLYLINRNRLSESSK